jgi:putative SOS response-associated peptidase YedK
MCGRFNLTGGSRLLLRFEEQFGVRVAEPENVERLLPEDGVTYLPFRDVPVFYTDSDGVTRVREMYWQLIHYWNREFKSSYTQFNTRAESLAKRHNRELLERRRCVFPVTSFFETRKEGGRTLKPKEIHEFSMGERGVIPLGGIYSVWVNPEDGDDKRYSCSIITTEPNELVAQVHDRMPFILPPEAVAVWLDREVTDFDRLMGLIKSRDVLKLMKLISRERK